MASRSVLRQVLPHLALADEDIEMIEPEVDEHFLQLALGQRGAQNLGLHQLADHGLRLLLRHSLFRRRRGLRRRVSGRHAGHRRVRRRACLLLFGLTPQAIGRLEVLRRQLRRAHGECREFAEPRVERAIRDTLGMQLLIDVRGEANLLDAGHVAGPRAVADAVEYVGNRSRVGLRRHQRPLGAEQIGGEDEDNGHGDRAGQPRCARQACQTRQVTRGNICPCHAQLDPYRGKRKKGNCDDAGNGRRCAARGNPR